MLILLVEPTEKKNEIMIGDDIVVRILEVYPETSQVRIGVEAPKDVRIDRSQVHEQRMKRIKKVLGQHIHG